MIRGNEIPRDDKAGLREIGYDGYFGYELCHPLPVVDGQTVGREFADKNARLACEYLKAVIKEATRG